MRGAYLKLVAMLLDSGCSKHMSPNKEMFTDYRDLSVHGVVNFGGGSIAHSIGIGTLMITRPDGSILYLKNALYVPALVVTLISVAQLTKSHGKCRSAACVPIGSHIVSVYRPLNWCCIYTVLPLSIQTLCKNHRHVASPNDIIFCMRRLHVKHLDRAHAVVSNLFTMLLGIPP